MSEQSPKLNEEEIRIRMQIDRESGLSGDFLHSFLKAFDAKEEYLEGEARFKEYIERYPFEEASTYEMYAQKRKDKIGYDILPFADQKKIEELNDLVNEWNTIISMVPIQWGDIEKINKLMVILDKADKLISGRSLIARTSEKFWKDIPSLKERAFVGGLIKKEP